MTIGARIQECVKKLAIGDAENAFIQLTIAIDGTAKTLYSGKRTSDRCKLFLQKSLPFVLWSLTNGTPTKTTQLTFKFSGSLAPNQPTEFEDLVYSVMRCALLHEGELPCKVEFVSAPYIGMLDGRMQFPLALIGALLFAVIASPSNAHQKVADSVLFFGGHAVKVADMLGSQEITKSAIRKGFQYDMEAILGY